MDYKATLMVLVLVSSALAGCTGDPDGGGTDELDSDALQDLFDEHFQDFINNTTVTVNNHYHNNTTVVNNDYDTNNEYNNTTNVDGEEITNYNQFNGSGASGSIMQMFTVNWDHSVVQITDYGSTIVTLNDTLQITTGNPYLLFALIYDGNLIEFENISCEQFRNFADMDDNHWQNWIQGTYGYGGDYHDAGYDLRDFFRNNAYYSNSNNPVNSDGESVRDQCPAIDGGGSYDYLYTTVFEIELSTGEALEFLSLPTLSDILLECDDGYIGTTSNGSVGNYLGGQANCTVSGITYVRHSISYSSHIWTPTTSNNSNNGSDSNNNAELDFDTSNIPEWWSDYGPYYQYSWDRWYFYGDGYDGHTFSPTPSEFAVYFTTYFVEVYDEGSE